MEPNFLRAHYRLGMAYVRKGMFKEAIAETQKAVALDRGDPIMLAQLGAIYAMCNEKRKALGILAKVQENHRQSGSMADAIATIYATLNDKEQSLRWLNAAYEAHDPLLMDVNTDLYWGALRSDPRFKDFLRHMGFPGS
jgi:tetratricopeptide (TPR) repeat protein